MNVQQSYFDFLQEQGAKEKIKSVIRKGIDKWKQHQAYEYKPTVNDFGDTSGEVIPIYGKTIDDICKTDSEVLLAYSGNSWATYCSGHGLDYNNVAKEISWDINHELITLRIKWIMKHLHELLVEYDVKDYDESWTEADVYEAIGEQMRMEKFYDHIWMAETFPEYLLDEDGEPSEYIQDLVFNITN